MNDWKKVEQNIQKESLQHPAQEAEQAAQAIQDVAEVSPVQQQAAARPEPSVSEQPAPALETAEAEEPVMAEPEQEVAVIHTSSRYTKRGRRKGRHKFAAPLGLAVILLAVVGLFSLVFFTISSIRSARDTTQLREDLYYELKPLAQYTPSAFADVNETKQDALMQAALYKIVNAELIRQRQAGTDQSLYPYDDYGRMIIPLDKVNAAYAQLFGNAAKPYHHTFGEDAGVYFTYEYNPDYEGKAVYHTPVNMGEASLYEPVIGTIKKSGGQLKVQVGYVYVNDIKPDDRGNDIITIDMANYYQIYTLQETQDGAYIIISVEDVK